ncbi:MAG: terminase small subunit [Oscillospiraceae bacterium]|nr:terminase small subunit [Oscillospiraceae bacterium]MBR2365912.1 terminase small subunit [Oscillospiraceae bacterium]MBR2977950.1 terminase small subunit [Oscillospiraceae bacterium]
MDNEKDTLTLTSRQQRFVHELLAGANATQAAIAAGYSEKTAAVQASRLLKDDRIAAYRRASAKKVYDRLGVSAETLALELETIKRRCMEAEPHLSWDPKAKAWVPDGRWIFDAGGAIKAIKTQADLLGVTVETDEPKKIVIEMNGVEQYAK